MSEVHEEQRRVILQHAPPLAHVIHNGFDAENRVIHLGEEFTSETGPWFAAALCHLGKAPIDIWLNTSGGDVEAMFAMHDCIRHHGHIRCFAYGQVCSAAVLILAASHERVVTESCVFMSHEPVFGEDELGLRAAKDRRKWEDWTHKWWCHLMGRYTPNDESWWKRTTERGGEYWLLGGEAIVQAGLADRVAQDPNQQQAEGERD